MKRQLVVIHGGDAFETYEEYLEYLRNKELNFDKHGNNVKRWKQKLPDQLPEYDVLAPQMPNPNNARYLEWKIWFEKFLPYFDDDLVLLGHSLGGIFLAKYLSEETFPKTITATLLVAAPYNTATDHPLVDFTITHPLTKLAEQGGELHLFHSKDDEVVPFSNFLHYQKELLGAHTMVFEDQGHFVGEDFPEVVEVLKRLA